MRLYALAPCVLVLALSGIVKAATIPCVGLPGSVLDVPGDVAVGDPDITCANLTVFGGNAVVLSVAFAAGTFNPATTVVQFGLDTDRNPATGHPGISSLGTIDAGMIGEDYIVDFGSTDYGSTGLIRQYTGPPINTFSFVGLAGVLYFDDGLQAVLPLPLLGGGSGLMNFKATSFRELWPGAFTGILDVAPDVGLPASVPSAVPEPAMLTLFAIGVAILALKRSAGHAR